MADLILTIPVEDDYIPPVIEIPTTLITSPDAIDPVVDESIFPAIVIDDSLEGTDYTDPEYIGE